MGDALTAEQWRERFADGAGILLPAPNNGATPGRRVQFTDFDAYRAAFPLEVDVLGDPLSEFLTVNGGSFDERIQLPDDADERIARLRSYTLTGVLPSGWTIEVGQNAPAFGRDGGALYLVVLGKNGAKMCVAELLDTEVLRAA